MSQQLIIAKKVAVGQVEFLDFALDDEDKLLVFSKFREASDFLHQEVSGEELLNFLVTTVDAQKDNPALVEAMAKGVVNMRKSAPAPAQESEAVVTQSEPDLTEAEAKDIEVFFALKCPAVNILNNEVLEDPATGKKYAVVLGFLDLETQEFVQHPEWELTAVYVGEFDLE